MADTTTKAPRSAHVAKSFLKDNRPFDTTSQGLRGYAAVIVFFGHVAAAYSTDVSYGFGVDGHSSIYQLPLVRLAYSSGAMVCLFFILSGYVRSVPAIRLSRHARWNELFHLLSSGTFRRAARLFLPAIASTFLTMIMVYLGVYDFSVRVTASIGGRRIQKFEIPIPRMDMFSGQFRHWLSYVARMLNPFVWEREFPLYNYHLWTTPVEFRNSMILNLVLLSLTRFRPVARSIIVCILICSFTSYGRFEVALNLSGMLLAEGEVALESTRLKDKGKVQRTKSTGVLTSRCAQLIIFITGLYLLSHPRLEGHRTPGFRQFASLTPESVEQSRFWQSVGGVLVIWSTNNSATVWPLFTNHTAQYLGGIASGIFAVHGPLLYAIGPPLLVLSSKLCEKLAFGRETCAFALATIVFFVGLLKSAEAFVRYIERPCTIASSWIDQKLDSSLVNQ